MNKLKGLVSTTSPIPNPNQSTPFTPALALSVKCNSMGTDYSLMENSTAMPIYLAKATTLGGHMTFTTADGRKVGTARYRNISSKIDIVVHGQSTTLTKGDHGKESQQFISTAHPGARRVWRPDAGGKNGLGIACVDEGGAMLAWFRFADSLRSLNYIGVLELGKEVAVGGPVMDEVVMTGMAIAQVRLQAD